MLEVKNPISTTKRLLQKALEGLKSLLSKAPYQRLPKNPPFNPKQTRAREACDQESRLGLGSTRSSSLKDTGHGRSKAVEKRRREEERRLARMRVAAERLKEVEMADKSGVVDVEEVFHYYSQLTDPAFLDIVDKLFMELQAELQQLSLAGNCFGAKPPGRMNVRRHDQV